MAEDLQRILECPMCFEFYDSNKRVPKLLQCQHTFCLPCILRLEKGHVITCPQCRKDQACPQAGASKIANNFTMLALVDVHQKSFTNSPSESAAREQEINPQLKVQQTKVQTPQISENVRNAIAILAQKLQERSNVMKNFDNKEQKTRESFLGVKKDIEASFDARIKDLTARRNTLIKQLGEIGKEEISFIQTQRSSALQYLKKFQDDFLRMKQIFQSGSSPSEMQLMQLLNICQGYNQQIEDYALSVDERTCEVSFSCPTLEQLLISMNSYGCLNVSKLNKSIINAPPQQGPVQSRSPSVSNNQQQANASRGNPFQSRVAVENRYEINPDRPLPTPPTSNSLTPSPSQSRQLAISRHMSLDMSSQSPRSMPGFSPTTSASGPQRRRPMSMSFSSNVLSTPFQENQNSETSSPSSTRSSSPSMTPPGSINRSQSNPTLVQPNHMLSPSSGHIPVRSGNSNHVHNNKSPASFASPMDILGPDVTGRSIFEKPSGIVPLGGGMLAIVDEIKHCLMIVTNRGQMVQVLGSQGNGVGEFQFPKAICTSPNDHYVISDWWNHRIQIWDRQGRSLGHFGTRGSEPNQLNGPVGIACDSKGNIFVCDFNNHCVKVFTAEGQFVRQIGKEGSRDGHFLNPTGIVLSAAGEILVTDSGKHCVQVFTQGGTYLYRFGEWGAEPGQLNCPSGIAVDSHGYIYVSNRGNHRIEVFNPSGSYARRYGTHGADIGQFDEPVGLAVLEDGRLAVCDSGNKRIQMVRPS